PYAEHAMATPDRHDALPISLAQAQANPGKPWKRLDDLNALPGQGQHDWRKWIDEALTQGKLQLYFQAVAACSDTGQLLHRKVLADRKSTRLNSSHVKISYAV